MIILFKKCFFHFIFNAKMISMVSLYLVSQNVLSGLLALMSPVSPVFYTEVTVMFGSKTDF